MAALMEYIDKSRNYSTNYVFVCPVQDLGAVEVHSFSWQTPSDAFVFDFGSSKIWYVIL